MSNARTRANQGLNKNTSHININKGDVIPLGEKNIQLNLLTLGTYLRYLNILVGSIFWYKKIITK